jgi:hypothetical protein
MTRTSIASSDTSYSTRLRLMAQSTPLSAPVRHDLLECLREARDLGNR